MATLPNQPDLLGPWHDAETAIPPMNTPILAASRTASGWHFAALVYDTRQAAWVEYETQMIRRGGYALIVVGVQHWRPPRGLVRPPVALGGA